MLACRCLWGGSEQAQACPPSLSPSCLFFFLPLCLFLKMSCHVFCLLHTMLKEERQEQMERGERGEGQGRGKARASVPVHLIPTPPAPKSPPVVHHPPPPPQICRHRQGRKKEEGMEKGKGGGKVINVCAAQVGIM